MEKSQEETPSENLILKEFLDKIPLRRLPINFSCGLPDGPGTDNLWVSDFDKYNAFIPKQYDRIYGAVENKENIHLIIFGQTGDDIYPTLFTYNNNGNFIDSLFLILNPCGRADEYQIPHSWAIIDKELKITLIDTTKFIHYPENNLNYIVDSLRFVKENYQIKPNGKIIKQ